MNQRVPFDYDAFLRDAGEEYHRCLAEQQRPRLVPTPGPTQLEISILPGLNGINLETDLKHSPTEPDFSEPIKRSGQGPSQELPPHVRRIVSSFMTQPEYVEAELDDIRQVCKSALNAFDTHLRGVHDLTTHQEGSVAAALSAVQDLGYLRKRLAIDPSAILEGAYLGRIPLPCTPSSNIPPPRFIHPPILRVCMGLQRLTVGLQTRDLVEPFFGTAALYYKGGTDSLVQMSESVSFNFTPMSVYSLGSAVDSTPSTTRNGSGISLVTPIEMQRRISSSTRSIVWAADRSRLVEFSIPISAQLQISNIYLVIFLERSIGISGEDAHAFYDKVYDLEGRALADDKIYQAICGYGEKLSTLAGKIASHDIRTIASLFHHMQGHPDVADNYSFVRDIRHTNALATTRLFSLMEGYGNDIAIELTRYLNNVKQQMYSTGCLREPFAVSITPFGKLAINKRGSTRSNSDTRNRLASDSSIERPTEPDESYMNMVTRSSLSQTYQNPLRGTIRGLNLLMPARQHQSRGEDNKTNKVIPYSILQLEDYIIDAMQSYDSQASVTRLKGTEARGESLVNFKRTRLLTDLKRRCSKEQSHEFHALCERIIDYYQDSLARGDYTSTVIRQGKSQGELPECSQLFQQLSDIPQVLQDSQLQSHDQTDGIADLISQYMQSGTPIHPFAPTSHVISNFIRLSRGFSTAERISSILTGLCNDQTIGRRRALRYVNLHITLSTNTFASNDDVSLNIYAPGQLANTLTTNFTHDLSHDTELALLRFTMHLLLNDRREELQMMFKYNLISPELLSRSLTFAAMERQNLKVHHLYLAHRNPVTVLFHDHQFRYVNGMYLHDRLRGDMYHPANMSVRQLMGFSYSSTVAIKAQFQNQLFVYPQYLSIISTNQKYRSFFLKIELRVGDTCSSSEIRRAIYPKLHGYITSREKPFNLCHLTPAITGTRMAYLYDEIKIELPLNLPLDAHIFFTLYGITDSKKKRKDLQEIPSSLQSILSLDDQFYLPGELGYADGTHGNGGTGSDTGITVLGYSFIKLYEDAERIIPVLRGSIEGVPNPYAYNQTPFIQCPSECVMARFYSTLSKGYLKNESSRTIAAGFSAQVSCAFRYCSDIYSRFHVYNALAMGYSLAYYANQDESRIHNLLSFIDNLNHYTTTLIEFFRMQEKDELVHLRAFELEFLSHLYSLTSICAGTLGLIFNLVRNRSIPETYASTYLKQVIITFSHVPFNQVAQVRDLLKHCVSYDVYMSLKTACLTGAWTSWTVMANNVCNSARYFTTYNGLFAHTLLQQAHLDSQHLQLTNFYAELGGYGNYISFDFKQKADASEPVYQDSPLFILQSEKICEALWLKMLPISTLLLHYSTFNGEITSLINFITIFTQLLEEYYNDPNNHLRDMFPLIILYIERWSIYILGNATQYQDDSLRDLAESMAGLVNMILSDAGASLYLLEVSAKMLGTFITLTPQRTPLFSNIDVCATNSRVRTLITLFTHLMRNHNAVYYLSFADLGAEKISFSKSSPDPLAIVPDECIIPKLYLQVVQIALAYDVYLCRDRNCTHQACNHKRLHHMLFQGLWDILLSDLLRPKHSLTRLLSIPITHLIIQNSKNLLGAVPHDVTAIEESDNSLYEYAMERLVCIIFLYLMSTLCYESELYSDFLKSLTTTELSNILTIMSHVPTLFTESVMRKTVTVLSNTQYRVRGLRYFVTMLDSLYYTFQERITPAIPDPCVIDTPLPQTCYTGHNILLAPLFDKRVPPSALFSCVSEAISETYTCRINDLPSSNTSTIHNQPNRDSTAHIALSRAFENIFQTDRSTRTGDSLSALPLGDDGLTGTPVLQQHPESRRNSVRGTTPTAYQKPILRRGGLSRQNIAYTEDSPHSDVNTSESATTPDSGAVLNLGTRSSCRLPDTNQQRELSTRSITALEESTKPLVPPLNIPRPESSGPNSSQRSGSQQPLSGRRQYARGTLSNRASCSLGAVPLRTSIAISRNNTIYSKSHLDDRMLGDQPEERQAPSERFCESFAEFYAMHIYYVSLYHILSILEVLRTKEVDFRTHNNALLMLSAFIGQSYDVDCREHFNFVCYILSALIDYLPTLQGTLFENIDQRTHDDDSLSYLIDALVRQAESASPYIQNLAAVALTCLLKLEFDYHLTFPMIFVKLNKSLISNAMPKERRKAINDFIWKVYCLALGIVRRQQQQLPQDISSCRDDDQPSEMYNLKLHSGKLPCIAQKFYETIRTMCERVMVVVHSEFRIQAESTVKRNGTTYYEYDLYYELKFAQSNCYLGQAEVRLTSLQTLYETLTTSEGKIFNKSIPPQISDMFAARISLLIASLISEYLMVRIDAIDVLTHTSGLPKYYSMAKNVIPHLRRIIPDLTVQTDLDVWLTYTSKASKHMETNSLNMYSIIKGGQFFHLLKALWNAAEKFAAIGDYSLARHTATLLYQLSERYLPLCDLSNSDYTARKALDLLQRVVNEEMSDIHTAYPYKHYWVRINESARNVRAGDEYIYCLPKDTDIAKFRVSLTQFYSKNTNDINDKTIEMQKVEPYTINQAALRPLPYEVLSCLLMPDDTPKQTPLFPNDPGRIGEYVSFDTSFDEAARLGNTSSISQSTLLGRNFYYWDIIFNMYPAMLGQQKSLAPPQNFITTPTSQVFTRKIIESYDGGDEGELRTTGIRIEYYFVSHPFPFTTSRQPVIYSYSERHAPIEEITYMLQEQIEEARTIHLGVFNSFFAWLKGRTIKEVNSGLEDITRAFLSSLEDRGPSSRLSDSASAAPGLSNLLGDRESNIISIRLFQGADPPSDLAVLNSNRSSINGSSVSSSSENTDPPKTVVMDGTEPLDESTRQMSMRLECLENSTETPITSVDAPRQPPEPPIPSILEASEPRGPFLLPSDNDSGYFAADADPDDGEHAGQGISIPQQIEDIFQNTDAYDQIASIDRDIFHRIHHVDDTFDRSYTQSRPQSCRQSRILSIKPPVLEDSRTLQVDDQVERIDLYAMGSQNRFGTAAADALLEERAQQGEPVARVFASAQRLHAPDSPEYIAHWQGELRTTIGRFVTAIVDKLVVAGELAGSEYDELLAVMRASFVVTVWRCQRDARLDAATALARLGLGPEEAQAIVLRYS
ncbi:hypothetical protein GMRT_14228 [Giardia muris]|uniref:C2 DOCK-type domain-containing protein n=1 Tax=Giardia muris TaxID=5742 RepID=A0A4Z1T805_GIAMU|nr:hypothetical protein GMRT_14228 [Giardia muris]|eukprot:TNJ30233.1 hypothetical protein GMRT_14228 [Giardia muris]